MKLKTFITITGRYTGGSKHSFFKSLNIGDTVEVSTKIANMSGASSGVYATMITLTNQTTVSESYIASMSIMSNTFRKMAFKECEE